MKRLDIDELRRRRNQGRLSAIDAENLLEALIEREALIRSRTVELVTLKDQLARAERAAAFAVGENARDAEMADGAVLLLAEAHQLAVRLQAITQRSAHHVSVRAQLSTGSVPQRETSEPPQLAAG